MPNRFPLLRAAILRDPWAILPDRLEAISEVVERRAEGIRLSPDEIASVKGTRAVNGTVEFFGASGDGDITPVELSSFMASTANSGQPPSVIAVINVMGIIAQHASQVDDISGPGGTSTERLSRSFRSAMADPSVTAIVFNIDSPGGSVSGVEALANEIFKARGKKPIISQVNSLMASAAYWIGAAADEIVMTPGSQAGSIGVYALHKDISKASDNEGVKFTFISAGKYKVEGNSFEPLSDEARAATQKSVDSYYADFTSAVAKFRGVKISDVRNGFGEGRVEKDTFAVEAGMADKIATLDETLRRVATMKPKGSMRAEEEIARISSASDDNAPSDEPITDHDGDIQAKGMTAEESDAFRRRRHAHRMRLI